MNSLDQAKELQVRTKAFAINAIHFYQSLPKSEEVKILGRQLLRSATSVAANYRAVCRAKSQADFISKMGTVVEETDETLLWQELLMEAQLVEPKKLDPLIRKNTELLKIFSKSLGTAKQSKKSLNP